MRPYPYGFVRDPTACTIDHTARSPNKMLLHNPVTSMEEASRTYEASASGQKVKFVVQRAQDKVVHVALASCSACYRSKNPHYALNGKMMCGKCKDAMDFALKGQKADVNHCTNNLFNLPDTHSIPL